MLRGYSEFLFQDKSGAIFRRDLPRLVGPAMTIILMDIAPVCLASNGNVQAFAAVDGLDLVIRPVWYKFPLLVGITGATAIPLLDIGPVILARNHNVQAFAAVDRLDVITAWGGRNGLGIGLFLEDVPGGIRMREGVVVGGDICDRTPYSSHIRH